MLFVDIISQSVRHVGEYQGVDKTNLTFELELPVTDKITSNGSSVYLQFDGQKTNMDILEMKLHQMNHCLAFIGLPFMRLNIKVGVIILSFLRKKAQRAFLRCLLA